jgi:hypothetical protein
MKRAIAMALLGIAAAVGVYCLEAVLLTQTVWNAKARPEEYLSVAFLIALPVALACGGFLSGYLNNRHKTSRLYDGLLLSPGIYLAIPVTAMNFLYGTSGFAMVMLVPILLWIVVSTASYFAGNTLSRRRSREQIA